MINNSNNPFNHLRTSILLPFKSTNQKNSFLTELTHLIQHQFLKKPQPFNSLLLVIILLFTEVLPSSFRSKLTSPSYKTCSTFINSWLNSALIMSFWRLSSGSIIVLLIRLNKTRGGCCWLFSPRVCLGSCLMSKMLWNCWRISNSFIKLDRWST